MRPPGVPNKNKKFLLSRLQDMYGESFHPIMKMAEAASKLDYIAEEEGDVAARRLEICDTHARNELELPQRRGTGRQRNQACVS